MKIRAVGGESGVRFGLYGWPERKRGRKVEEESRRGKNVRGARRKEWQEGKRGKKEREARRKERQE